MSDLTAAPVRHSAQGYHGTSRENAGQILAAGFLPSTNDYDWLGRGVYFWQDAPLRARAWAAARFGPTAVVVSATIDTAGCLDLLDFAWQTQLSAAYKEFTVMAARLQIPLPVQTVGAHRLDNAVLEFLVGILRDAGIVIRSVRSAFAEGKPVYPGSAILQHSHVQIAVRDHAVISELEVSA